jgi:PhoPQ-activated pathogenicity-related protein
MLNQLSQWGHYSPAIQAYTKRGLQASSSTASGHHLATIVDPFSYLPHIHARILSVRGTNDPYWAVNAYSIYQQQLPYDSSYLALPNEAHDFKDKTRYFQTACAFAASCAAGSRWPNVTLRRFRGLSVYAEPEDEVKSVRLYFANPSNPDFSTATWKLCQTLHGNGASKYRFNMPAATEFFEAVFAQADFQVKIRNRTFRATLSSPPAVFHAGDN